MIKINLHKTLLSSSESFELGVQVDLNQNEFISIYGNSGVGKTTILRLLSGLSKPDSGTIEVNGEIWFDAEKKINLTPKERKIGFVFQDFALFPNMTVKQNLEYALEKDQNTDIISELIDIIDLKDFQNRKPETLSGGQKQRVALARALVQKPEFLLLDEPLSAVDHEMRIKLQNYLAQIHVKYNLTCFLVSHNLAEVFKLSDTVIKINKGVIEKKGTPEEVFKTDFKLENINVVGEVLSLSKVGDLVQVKVNTENGVTKISLSEESIKNIQVGDQIVLKSKIKDVNIDKIQ